MLLSTGTDLFKQYLIKKQKSPETVRGYTMDLNQLERYISNKYNCPTYIEDLTEQDIEDYLEMLHVEKNYATASINRHLNSIRSICQFAYKQGWVKEDVSKDIESLKREQKERTHLEMDELEELFPAISHPLIQLATRLMAFTGLRVSECVNLTLDQVDLKKDLIFVVEGKGKKDRTVPISKALKPYLVEYVNHWRVQTDSPYFFATKKTGRLSPQYINRELHDATKRLGWNKVVTAHILRHSFASIVAQKGSLVNLMKILGHADLKTTSIYLHSSQAQLRETVDLV